MNPDGEAESLSPAEEGLLRYLHALREDGVEPPPPFAGALRRTARWQAEIRPLGLAAWWLTGAIGDYARIAAARRGS